MRHDNHYHIHSDPTLLPPPAAGAIPPGRRPSNATVQREVPSIEGTRTETIAFYSLQRDLWQLRRDATAKRILSPNDRAEHRPHR